MHHQDGAASPTDLVSVVADVSQDLELQKLRDAVSKYKRLYETTIKREAEEERLIELFATSIASFTLPRRVAVVPSRPLEKTTSQESAVLALGDLQVGEVISAEETHGINSYDFQVYQDRLEYLEDRTLDICFQHQRGQFSELVVAGLGDNVSGRIHEELQKYGAQHVIDQVYIGATVMALFLARLSRRFPRLRYVGISGNHGRLDKQKEAKQYYKNFDYLWNSILSLRLRHVPNVTVDIPQAIFTLVEVAQHRLLLSHGMELPPSPLGIPLYSINRASAGYQELLAVAKEGRYDYWLMGHMHRPMELDNAIVNGCLCGLSELGIGRFKPIRPMQKLIGIHPVWGKAWEYPIRLDHAPSAVRYRFGSDSNVEETNSMFDQGLGRQHE